MRELIISLVVLGVALGIDLGICKLLCFCFGIAFSWKIFIGFLIIIAILNGIFKKRN